MQIPILNGIYTDGDAEFRTSYPRNMVPVPKQQGISQGYLRPADGLIEIGTGPGVDRGGINWNGQHYRVMGSKLVRIESSGRVDELGDVGSVGQVTLDYSFDRLAIASGGRLFYWNGSTLVQVSDPDLGTVLDFVWVDGYFMTTDGSSLVVTQLNDPTQVDPLKYGSAEADPDPIKGLVKIRNEVYAINRYTIEVFQNVGGDYFPFERVEGAQVMRGAVGTYAACELQLDTDVGVAFLGSARDEPPAVWFGINGASVQLSTREIDTLLQEYSEADLATAVLETRTDKAHIWLYVHLPDQTLVYDAASSKVAGEQVWFTLDSGVGAKETYRGRNFVWCYDQWNCGDPTTPIFGRTTGALSSHYGEVVGWEFGTLIVYNEGHGAIFHELELVCLTGRVELGADPTIWTSYTVDGQTWSQERPRPAGKIGERLKRLNWLQQGHMRHWRVQKFRGTSDTHISVARLEARIEGLNV